MNPQNQVERLGACVTDYFLLLSIKNPMAYRERRFIESRRK